MVFSYEQIEKVEDRGFRAREWAHLFHGILRLVRCQNMGLLKLRGKRSPLGDHSTQASRGRHQDLPIGEKQVAREAMDGVGPGRVGGDAVSACRDHGTGYLHRNHKIIISRHRR